MDYYPDSSSDSIDDQLTVFCSAMTAASALSYALNFPMLKPDVFDYSKGKKYARVFYNMSNGQRFVACFVDMSNGDVWKADGWKKPALNFVRGNIASKEGRAAILREKTQGETLHFYAGF